MWKETIKAFIEANWKYILCGVIGFVVGLLL